MKLTIRDAGEEDLPRIVEIYNEAVIEGLCVEDKPVDTKDKREWFFNADPCFVYEQDNLIVGWVSLDPLSSLPVFAKTKSISIFIMKEFRRCGIGKALLQPILRVVKTNELKLLASMWSYNTPSHLFFKRVGFTSSFCININSHRNEKALGLLVMQQPTESTV